MFKLLQINVTANWGSTGKIAEQIGQLAIAKGWESHIAYGRMKNPSKSNLIKVGSRIDVYKHYIEGLILDNEGLASRWATKSLIREIDRISPDIVHLHNIHDHFMNYRILLRYLAEKNIPVVWTQHDQWITTGHCMYNLCGCEKWKTECNNCPLSKFYSLDRSSRNFRLKKKLCADIPSLTIVPVSEWLADNIRQSHLKNRPIHVIHNGIDIHTFSPQKSNVHERYCISENKKIVIGVAAIWSESKGLLDFYKLAQVLPSDEYAIMLVGKMPNDRPKVCNGCQMVFVDRTQNPLELAQLYSAASVFVNPTYADMFPTVNLEAIACGVPVVTYRTGGSPEAVDDKTGAVVDQGDIDGLVSQICKFASGNYKEACRNKAELNFDKSLCFQQYLDLYSTLLGESSER